MNVSQWLPFCLFLLRLQFCFTRKCWSCLQHWVFLIVCGHVWKQLCSCVDFWCWNIVRWACFNEQTLKPFLSFHFSFYSKWNTMNNRLFYVHTAKDISAGEMVAQFSKFTERLCLCWYSLSCFEKWVRVFRIWINAPLNNFISKCCISVYFNQVSFLLNFYGCSSVVLDIPPPHPWWNVRSAGGSWCKNEKNAKMWGKKMYA